MGTPLLVGEERDGLVPNGALDEFKLSRKLKGSTVLALRSTDSGATWAAFTPTLNIYTNFLTLTNEPAGNLVMIFYETEASPLQLASNAEVVTIGEVWGGNFHIIRLVSDLVGKVANEIIGKLTGTTPVISHELWRETAPHIFISNELFQPEHRALGLTGGIPAVKALPYLTRAHGKLYLQMLFKEMQYDVDWGDDGKFNIIDGEVTTTDDNGNTIRIGQKRLELPFFIDDGE